MTWTDHIKIASESVAGVFYTIARQDGTDLWGCDCRGWTNYGKCKHLRQQGKKSFRDPLQNGGVNTTQEESIIEKFISRHTS